MIFSCFLVAYYYLKFFQKVWLSIATFCVISENKIESNRLMALYIWSSYFLTLLLKDKGKLSLKAPNSLVKTDDSLFF